MFTPTVMILKTSSARKTATVTVITLTKTHLKIFSNTLTASKVMTMTATMMMTAMMMTATMTVTAQATILLKASAKAITAVTPALLTHPLTLQA